MFNHYDLYKLAAQKMLDDNYYILDTETTGLGNDDEIVELGIIDSRGNVLYESLFHPEKEMHWAAAQVSHISNEMMEAAPYFKDEFQKIMQVLDGHPVIAFNELFDERLFYQTAHRYGLDKAQVDTAFSHAFCCQHLYDQYLGFDGHAKLETACAAEDVDMIQNHRATGDCQMTLALLEKIAEPGRIPNLFKYKAIKAGHLKKEAEPAPQPAAPAPAEERPAKKEKPRLPWEPEEVPSYLSLYKESKSIAEIAEIRGVKTSTVETRLVELYLKGDIDNIDFMIDDQYVPQIVEASRDKNWDGRLRSIKEKLPEKCSYACIRAVLAKLEKEPDSFSDKLTTADSLKPGDVCFYSFGGDNKSRAVVEIVKILDDPRGAAEIKFRDVIVDDTGNGLFNYLHKTGQTMNASFKYLQKKEKEQDINPAKKPLADTIASANKKAASLSAGDNAVTRELKSDPER